MAQNGKIAVSFDTKSMLADINEYVSKVEKELSGLQKFSSEINIGESFITGIKEALAELKVFQKEYKTALNSFASTKVDTKDFAKFQKQMNTAIENINGRITVIEKSFKEFQTVANGFDSSGFENRITNMIKEFDGFNNKVNETSKLLKQFFDMTSSSTKISSNINTSEYEKLSKILKELNNNTIGKKSGIEIDVKEAEKQLIEFSDKFYEIERNLKAAKKAKNNDMFASYRDSLIELQPQLAQIINRLIELKKIDVDELLSGENLVKIDNNHNLSDIAVDLEGSMDRMTEYIQKQHSKIKQEIDETTEEVKELGATSFTFKNGGIQIPISLDKTTITKIKPDMEKVIDALNAYSQKNPVNVTMRLFNLRGSRDEQREVTKQLSSVQADIAKIEDEGLRTSLNGLVDNLENQFRRSLKLEIETSLSQDPNDIQEAIKKIKEFVGDEKIPLNLELVISGEEITKLEEKVDQIRKDLSLSSSNEVTEMSNALKTLLSDTNSKDWSNNLVSGLNDIQEKLKEIIPMFKEVGTITDLEIGKKATKSNTKSKTQQKKEKDIARDVLNKRKKKIDVSEAEEAGKEVVEAAKQATAETQQSNSPSRVAELLGGYWGEGYAKGIVKHKNDVEDAVKQLVQAGKITTEELIKDMPNISGNKKYWNLLNPVANIISGNQTGVSSNNNSRKIASLKAQITRKTNSLLSSDDIDETKLQRVDSEVAELIGKLRELGVETKDIEQKYQSATQSIADNLKEVGNLTDEGFDYGDLGKNTPDPNALKELEALSEKISEEQNEISQSYEQQEQKAKEAVNTEEGELYSLIGEIDKVIEAIASKTSEFQKEGQVVEGVVQNEISNLEILSGWLISIKNDIESVSGEFKNIDFSFKTNSDTDTITKFVNSLSKVKSDAIASKFSALSKDLTEFTNRINSLKINDNNILSSIQNLLNKSKELDNLSSILKESKGKIKEAGKAMANTSNSSDSVNTKSAKKYFETLRMYSQDNLADLNRNKVAIDEVTEAWNKLTQEEKEALSVDYAKTVDAELNKLLNDLKSLGDNNKFTDDFKQQISGLIGIINRFKGQDFELDLLDENKVGRVWEDLNKIYEEINKISQQKGMSEVFKASEISLEKLISKMLDFQDKNTAMSKQNQSILQSLIQRAQALGETDKEAISSLTEEFLRFQNSVKTAGQTGLSFFDQVAKRARSMSASFIGMYFSLYDWVRYIRNAITTIKDLDTQLVDLRKTTTMSTSDLGKFYTESNDIAKQLGVTTSEIISQASAWSRLGFSSKEASEEMAALSSQFKQISPGMDLDQATDGLVSTMKAFHVDVEDVEREIMDVVNRTGNTMATSNEEVVEMLTRSSAAMAAANNSIKETIALESAAVQITRNAETTGTAFRTKNCPYVQRCA